VVPALVDRLLQAADDGAEEIIVGDLSTRRDFSDVRDVVRAYRLLAEKGISGEVYNIASGVDVGLFDIAQRLVAAIAPHVRLVTDESLIRPVEVPVSMGSYEKLRRATKWRPTITLDTSLNDVIVEMRRRRGDS
jgi:GDP-4-dehydro-6-deoxy-D-mannose reductase